MEARATISDVRGTQSAFLVLMGNAAFSHSRVPRRRSALAITETELRLMAVAASIGLSSSPVKG